MALSADAVPALVWTSDQDGRCSFVNDAWLAFTGRSLEQELGDGWHEVVHPDDRQRRVEALKNALPYELEFRLLRQDGEYRFVHERAVLATGGGLVGSCMDVHERRIAEEALRASERSFRALADSAPVMIWTTDLDGLVTFVNEGWLAFTGTTLEEELGESWTLGVHPADQQRMLDSWYDALALRETWSAEYRLRRHDGEYRWIVDRGVARYSEGGEFMGYVGTANDIHERKQMEEALRRVYEREHRVAETLQRSLLPEKLPEIEGVSLAARYLPAGEGAAVGGDWYDAAELPDGRVALVVGDVVGHGLRAAAVMGQLRNAFRAYAISETTPAELIARLNRLVMNSGEGVMATVLYLALDRDSGDVTYTSAGHPPPLVIAPDGTYFLEGGRSIPVGAADLATFKEEHATIPPDATLLLYTDGLVERRDTPIDERFTQLAEAAGRDARRRSRGPLRWRARRGAGRQGALRRRGPAGRPPSADQRRAPGPGPARRARGARHPAPAARPLPARGRGLPGGGLRDHADDQ